VPAAADLPQLRVRQADEADHVNVTQLPCHLLQIYRNFEFGKLMKLVMLDTRIIGEHMP
jgi:phosphodiesterase/alkaline phosphatase D-like protein